MQPHVVVKLAYATPTMDRHGHHLGILFGIVVFLVSTVLTIVLHSASPAGLQTNPTPNRRNDAITSGPILLDPILREDEFPVAEERELINSPRFR